MSLSAHRLQRAGLAPRIGLTSSIPQADRSGLSGTHTRGQRGCLSRLSIADSFSATGSTCSPACAPESHSRRQFLLGLAWAAGNLAAAAEAVPAAEAATTAAPSVAELQSAAAQAYADRDFASAVDALNQIIEREPAEVKWREMRAQALVDGKNFYAAVDDFDWALKQLPQEAAVDRARLLSGRGLAYEGLGDWVAALKDYDQALALAESAGQLPDPYVLNSRGNCHASLGEWRRARESYLASAEGFQSASGFRLGRSTTPRLDGAVFAASNAALMLAQLGDEAGAVKEMQDIARRAPGSVDMRAALAALYWQQGLEAEAEASWEFACNRITTGCSRYQDQEWLITIRRWPPVMCSYMKDFLALRSSGRGAGTQAGRAAFRE